MKTDLNYSQKVDFANTLRGIAALCVVVTHYFGVFWLGRSTVASFINAPELPLSTHWNPTYIIWLHKFPLLNWGAYGVALFFIISGFVIPFSLQKGNTLEFCINRMFRIMPIYIVGFSITLIALLLSTLYFHTQWPYTQKEVFIHFIPGLRDILWSRNIDGIVWTLEIEVKFYLICVITFSLFRHYSQKIFLVPLSFFLLACFFISNLNNWGTIDITLLRLINTYIMYSQYIIFMFIGVIFHYIFCEKIEYHKGYLGIAILFILFCIEWWAGPYSASINSAWSYGFALVTFMFAYSYPQLFKGNFLFNFFADISYPLYVIHGLAGYVLLRILLDKGFKAWLALIIVWSGVMLLSWILHKCIEQQAQMLGKKLGINLTSWLQSRYRYKSQEPIEI
jgi:peptidoglycan/LPS O-acetylase OafA/YrhL